MPWEIVTRDDGPCQRSLHVAAVWRDKLIIFGGYDGSNRVNDLWLYNFSHEEWGLVRGGGTAPSPRDRHVGLVWGSSFYVFGGFDGANRVSDMHEFSFGSYCWSRVRPMSGTPPSPRHSHAGVVHGDSVYIFGGYDGSYRSDFHEFNFISCSWSPINAQGRSPRARYRATCVRVEAYMYLFGGHDGSRHLNDVHLFDIQQRRWSELETEGPAPTPRDSHAAIAHGRCMYVFGGSTGSAMDDFHVLRLDTAVWEPVTLSQQATADTTDTNTILAHQDNNNDVFTNTPPPQEHEQEDEDEIANAAFTGDTPGARFCHVAVEYRDALYIFGGYDGGSRLNDFLRYPLVWWNNPTNGVLEHDDEDLGSAASGSFTGGLLSNSITTMTGDMSRRGGTDLGIPSLVHDLRALVDSPLHSDVTFLLDDGEIIHAHKVLCQRCPYFKAMFGSSDSTNSFLESTAAEITIPDTRKPIFLNILEFLYTDHCHVDLDIAMDLFQAADRFGVDRLKKICEAKMLASISVDNACSIFHAADRYMANNLRDKSLHYILRHFDDVTQTSAFEDMGRSNVDLVFDILRARSSGGMMPPCFASRTGGDRPSSSMNERSIRRGSFPLQIFGTGTARTPSGSTNTALPHSSPYPSPPAPPDNSDQATAQATDAPTLSPQPQI